MPHDDVIAQQFHDWTETALGRALIEQEKTHLLSMLSKLYGPIALQYGAPELSQFLESSNAIRRIHSVHTPLQKDVELFGSLLYSLPEVMPFDTRSVNLLILPHVLEFCHDPHLVLREAERVLVSEGHLVLVCFNPLSFWGIRNKIGRILSKDPPAPWSGRFFGLSRVKDWLSVLGFEVVSGSSAVFTPPVKSTSVRQKFQFLENAGARWWPMCAGVFFLVVRKREFGVTPLAAQWRTRRRISTGLAEPVTRNG